VNQRDIDRILIDIARLGIDLIEASEYCLNSFDARKKQFIDYCYYVAEMLDIEKKDIQDMINNNTETVLELRVNLCKGIQYRHQTLYCKKETHKKMNTRYLYKLIHGAIILEKEDCYEHI